MTVKAKTKNAEIILNDSLIDEDNDKILAYLIHELTHVFQHIKRYGKKDPYKKYEYLDRPDEISAFQNQIKQKSKSEPKSKVKKYVEDLVDYHDIPKNEVSKKEDQLMKKIK